MRITDLEVDGFGVWSGLELAELSGELNVFYGPNEAGKTTLMQFVRSVLYGFSRSRRERYLPPVHPGRPGGSMRAVAGGKQYTIDRHADEPGELGETTRVTDGAGVLAEPGGLATLLGEVDEPTYNNVFAFGLREIQELGSLSDTRAADELYNLALGLDRVSLLDVMRELETSRTRLLASDERPSLVTQLVSQRERLQAEIDELAQATPRYLALEAERDKLADEIARLQAEVARFDAQGRELALARSLVDRWQRRAAAETRLAMLSVGDDFPEGALTRFEHLESRLDARRRRFEKLGERRHELAERIGALNVNEALCRQALRFEALGEQRQWMASLEQQIGELEAELLELESRRDQAVGQFGIRPEAAAAGGSALSKRDWSQLRTLAKSLHDARRELGALVEKIAAARETTATHNRQIAAGMGPENPTGLTHALAEAGELVSQLRKRVQIDQRLDQMARRETELEEQSHEHLEKQILPTWAIVGVGGLFVLGCALVLLFVAGLVLPVTFSRALSWPVGLVGVLAAAAAALVKVTMEHSASRQLDNCHSQLHLLGEQIKQAKADRDELDEKLPRGGGPLVARMQTAEKALARLEELLPLEAQRETAEREAAALTAQSDARAAAYRDLKKQWRRVLAEHGLPTDLKPRQLRAFAQHRHALGELTTAIDGKQADLARRRGELETLSGRITQLIGETGFAPGTTRPLEQLGEALAELGQQQARFAQRETLAREMARVSRQQRKLKRAAQTLRRRRKRLLAAAGTSDVGEFRRLAQVQAEAARLRAERDQLNQEISAAIAGQLTTDKLVELMASAAQLEQLEAHVADARRIATEHANQALERRGEMNQQLKALVDDRRLAAKRVELGVIDKRLRDALDRWRVVTTCGMMLEAVRAYYEREHQPPALREASGYLQRLTGGRYTRVWTPLGEHALRVDDSQGNSLRVELLSRGTREQLFLALRLALVGSFARRGVQLPLVLDDVLVNFDAGRARAAANVLRDFARAGHQLLVFTCHEHIARLFKQLKAEVRQLPDNGQLPLEVESPRKARRARPEPEPEPVAEEAIEEDEAPDEVLEEVAEIEPEIVTEPPPVPSPPRVAPRVERAVPRRVERVEWSAEEFEGELADRVRREDRDRRERASDSEASDDDDDAEAA